MQKKVHVEIWGGPHNKDRRIPMMIDPTLISKTCELDVKNLTDFQRNKIFKHVCGNHKCDCKTALTNIKVGYIY